MDNIAERLSGFSKPLLGDNAPLERPELWTHWMVNRNVLWRYCKTDLTQLTSFNSPPSSSKLHCKLTATCRRTRFPDRESEIDNLFSCLALASSELQTSAAGVFFPWGYKECWSGAELMLTLLRVPVSRLREQDNNIVMLVIPYGMNRATSMHGFILVGQATGQVGYCSNANFMCLPIHYYRVY